MADSSSSSNNSSSSLRDLTHTAASQLVHWREPKKSAAAFGLSLLVLLSVATLSVISVVSYLLLACLCVTITFRVYKSVIQLAAVTWVMTYVGAVFNGVTILILADIIFFTTPLIYQKKKAQIDRHVEAVRLKLEETLQSLQDKLPGAVKKSKVE
ncbi:reticulon-3-like [Neolamprologus brichardi]|uniref:reticulon-3-like n=1 Tax=Neolamprologus brichardi TaxID=32507 RepID=UPI001643BAA8|nr:reticulon-3-like [Neolamprologus brichardi]